MYLDKSTLRDLDIFAAASGDLTIFSMLDRTRTEAGRHHLRLRVTQPVDTAAEILALQDAHRAIASDLEAIRSEIDRADLDGVTRYLGSRWTLPSAMQWPIRLLSHAWLGVRYPAYLNDVAEGQRQVRAMLRAADNLARRFADLSNPVLSQLCRELAGHLDSRECKSLLQLPTEGSSRLVFDGRARGAARKQLLTIVDLLAQLEALWSVAAATVEHAWEFPIAGHSLSIRGLKHPFLRHTAVANDLELDEAIRVCFVTGPNMAGKSTFLRAVMIALLLAHIGCGVPAQSMTFAPVRGLFSSINIVDNIVGGESYFLAEVRRIGSLAATLRQHGSVVAVLDEPFRGTNVHDAGEATMGVVLRLAQHRDSVTFIASHLAEIGPAMANDPRIRFLHFAANVDGGAPIFDFTVRNGLSDQRLGMMLFRQEGVLDLLDSMATPSPENG